ncbi:MAG: hypothetical protein ACRDIE_19865 [Chloroflexota bacterium]
MNSSVVRVHSVRPTASITVVVGVVGIISARRRLTAGRGLDHAGGRGTGGG